MTSFENLLDNPLTHASGKKIRLIVSSADEAVKIIREKLGSKAQVISVKQIEGEGFARFLKSPKLEVIATIPKKTLEIKTHQTAPTHAIQSTYSSPQPSTTPPTSQNLTHFLKRLGFDDQSLLDLFSNQNEQNWEILPLNHALKNITEHLRYKYTHNPQKPLSSRVAFMGTPGSGITTALCKLLSQAIFCHHQKAQVLKWESDGPNADEALRVFCEVLGVPLYRDPIDRPHLHPEHHLYIDIPGMELNHSEWTTLSHKLDDLKIDTRIFVIHGLYEKDYLQRAYLLAERLKSTHIIFTHLDENPTMIKFLPFIFRKNLTVLGFSHGQSLTSDFNFNPFESLLTAIFPAERYSLSS